MQRVIRWLKSKPGTSKQDTESYRLTITLFYPEHERTLNILGSSQLVVDVQAQVHKWFVSGDAPQKRTFAPSSNRIITVSKYTLLGVSTEVTQV